MKDFKSQNAWKKLVEQLASLQLGQLLMPTAVQAIYDLVVTFDNTGKRLLSNPVCTRTLVDSGKIIDVGKFGDDGTCIGDQSFYNGCTRLSLSRTF